MRRSHRENQFFAGGERPNLKTELMPLLGEIEIDNIGKALCLSIPKDPIFFDYFKKRIVVNESAWLAS